MSLYATSALAKAQVKATQLWNNPETRAKTPSVMALAIKNAPIAIPSPEIERVHQLRTVDINFFAKTAAGSTTAKAAYHEGNVGDSAKQNLTYVTIVEKFSLRYKLADNNVFSYEQMFMNQYEQAWKNAMARQDSAALAALIAARCQLTAANLATPIAASGAGTWSDVTKALEIAAADDKVRLQKAESFMKARQFGQMYDVVADLRTMADLTDLLNQGAGNNQNTQFQFGNSQLVPTQDIISSDYNGSFLILPKASFAGIVWNDKQNLKGVNVGGKEGLLTTALDPFGYGVRADLSVYTHRADTYTDGDTTSGSTQDFIDQYELTVTVAYATAPLSTASDGVAHLVGLSS